MKSAIFNNKDVLEEWRLQIINFATSYALTSLSSSFSSTKGAIPTTTDAYPVLPHMTSSPTSVLSPIIPSTPASDSAVLEITPQLFKSLLRTLLLIGASLNHSKDVRDLFLNLLEKIVEPVQSSNWSERDLDLFMEGMLGTWENLKLLPGASHKRFQGSWKRLILGLRGAVVRIMAATREARESKVDVKDVCHLGGDGKFSVSSTILE